MSNLFSARETLAESFRNRLEFIRNDEAPGGYVAIAAFHIPINESIPDRDERKRRCLAYASQTETSHG